MKNLRKTNIKLIIWLVIITITTSIIDFLLIYYTKNLATSLIACIPTWLIYLAIYFKFNQLLFTKNDLINSSNIQIILLNCLSIFGYKYKEKKEI